MNENDAMEIAYKNGFNAGGIAAAKRILRGIGERLQKAKFSDMKERFILLDLIKTYEEEYKDDECAEAFVAFLNNENIGEKDYE